MVPQPRLDSRRLDWKKNHEQSRDHLPGSEDEGFLAVEVLAGCRAARWTMRKVMWKMQVSLFWLIASWAVI